MYFGFGCSYRLGGVCEDLGLGSGVLDQRRESGVEWRGGLVIAISWNGLGYVEEAAASLERGRT